MVLGHAQSKRSYQFFFYVTLVFFVFFCFFFGGEKELAWVKRDFS
jgi:hypothetical protein